MNTAHFVAAMAKLGSMSFNKKALHEMAPLPFSILSRRGRDQPRHSGGNGAGKDFTIDPRRLTFG
jgi:hypothetical protein